MTLGSSVSEMEVVVGECLVNQTSKNGNRMPDKIVARVDGFRVELAMWPDAPGHDLYFAINPQQLVGKYIRADVKFKEVYNSKKEGDIYQYELKSFTVLDRQPEPSEMPSVVSPRHSQGTRGAGGIETDNGTHIADQVIYKEACIFHRDGMEWWDAVKRAIEMWEAVRERHIGPTTNVDGYGGTDTVDDDVEVL